MPNQLDANKAEFQGVIEHYQKDLQTLRTGRASVAMVGPIPVAAYGGTMEMKAVASITTPDARTVQIEPWDRLS